MRKVKFKQWIPVQYIEEPVFNADKSISMTRRMSKKPDTGCWDSDFIHNGLFHQWGTSFIEET